MDDQLKRQHNLATNNGPFNKRFFFLADPQFVQIMDDILIHWQEKANNIRKEVNQHLRAANGDADMGDYSIGGVKTGASFPDYHPHQPHFGNLTDRVTVYIADKAEAKKFPSEEYSQVVKVLVGDLKSILINQFMRVLIIHVQRTLDVEFERVVGGGIAMLVF